MGRQGSGKGTQGERLARDLSVPRIEIGAIVRDRGLIDDEVGRKIAAQSEAGGLADEAFVVQSLAEWLAREPTRGFVLDGFPRKGTQVETLDAMLARLGVRLDAPVHLMIDENLARQRMADRLVCPECKRSTNVASARLAGPCPTEGCGGVLDTRKDDRDPGSVDQRLSDFRELTVPVIDEYRDAGRLIEIDASRREAVVYEDLLAQLHSIRTD